jgi:hypothetical protein
MRATTTRQLPLLLLLLALVPLVALGCGRSRGGGGGGDDDSAADDDDSATDDDDASDDDDAVDDDDLAGEVVFDPYIACSSLNPTPVCNTADTLYVFARVANPGDSPANLVTIGNCLSQLTVLSSVDSDWSDSVENHCEDDDDETWWLIEPNDDIYDTMAYGTLEPGDYELSVTFRDEAATVATFAVTIEP